MFLDDIAVSYLLSLGARPMQVFISFTSIMFIFCLYYWCSSCIQFSVHTEYARSLNTSWERITCSTLLLEDDVWSSGQVCISMWIMMLLIKRENKPTVPQTNLSHKSASDEIKLPGVDMELSTYSKLTWKSWI